MGGGDSERDTEENRWTRKEQRKVSDGPEKSRERYRANHMVGHGQNSWVKLDDLARRMSKLSRGLSFKL